ncbi:ABC transporter ATP-binding protein [Mesorhizobium sp. SP-1A]|uniref:ABC transporter ATP-binding protein n=1 Tax=Mesorhizobium sp. SP-1A TaxID=3077840 RepID=UPI0028F6CF23|nr:ABC transporter ATP-binding protein [Mesorhizobium sp. SP-1A]
MSVRLELAGLEKAFGALSVLKGMDLSVAPGEFVSLLGPSGCGKTTTLNIIAGFELPDRGEVVLGQDKITRLPPHLRGLGMVFQSHALFPHMTVAENVAFPLIMQKRSRQEIKGLVSKSLELIRLEGYASRYPRELSGGQQQRVGLARALTAEPKIILLDEPLSSLDAQLRRDMAREIRRIVKAVDITAIYVTHDQEEALTMSDRIVVMNRGCIEQAGSPIEIYNNPRTEFVAGFVGHATFLSGTLKDAAAGLVELNHGGNVSLPPDAALGREGDSVRLAIRPDRLMLSPAHGATSFRGVLKSQTFVGAIVRCEIELPGGLILQAHCAAHRPLGIQTGESVEICVEPGDWIRVESAVS